jgi:hypothetical protein
MPPRRTVSRVTDNPSFPPGHYRKRRRPVWFWAITAFLILCVAGVVVAALHPGAGKPTADPTTVTTSVPAAAGTTPAKVTAKPTPATYADGTWKVGTEIKAGTYTTTAGDFGCYWARLKNFDGDFSSIITNGNLDSGAHGRLTVKSTDKGLELSGGCQWRRES